MNLAFSEDTMGVSVFRKVEVRPVRSTSRQVLRFIIVGVVATLLHWYIYALLKEFFRLRESDDWGLSVAYSVGYALSLLVNYTLSLKYTFNTQGNFGKWLGFVFSHAVNYAMHIALLNLFLQLGVGQLMVRLFRMASPGLLEAMSLSEDPLLLLPLPIFIIVVPINFLLVRFFLVRGDPVPRHTESKNDIS